MESPVLKVHENSELRTKVLYQWANNWFSISIVDYQLSSRMASHVS